MYIKQFRSFPVPVPDPLRPGRTAYTTKLVPTGATGLSHDGREYPARSDGWIDVPHDVGLQMLGMRYPGGECWCTPVRVNEEVRRERFDEPADAEGPSEAKAPARRTRAQTA